MSLREYDAPFENIQVWDEDLPRVETLNFVGLEPSKLKVDVISTGILFVILAAVIFVSGRFTIPYYDEYSWIAWLVWGVLLAISLLTTILGFRIKKYALRSQDIVYSSGLIWHKDIAIPFNRVQHCEVNEGPIERLYGLARLSIFTAGGSASDLTIAGIKPETAHRLKAYIVKKTYDEEE